MFKWFNYNNAAKQLCLYASHIVISFYCGSCWRKQLLIAKDARRVDVLYFRIGISYRLLDGTSRFKELHDIVASIKAKLDTELGPASGVSTKMARCIVSRLSVAGDVQALCSTAIEKADEWLAATSSADPNCRRPSGYTLFISFFLVLHPLIDHINPRPALIIFLSLFLSFRGFTAGSLQGPL